MEVCQKTNVLSTSAKHTTLFLGKNVRGCCGTTVMTAACYWPSGHCIGVVASNFWGCKRFLPKVSQTCSKRLSCNFCRPFLWCDLQINGLHLCFCKPWAPFFQVKQRWAPFLPRFQGILPRYLGILLGFSRILPKFLAKD